MSASAPPPLLSSSSSPAVNPFFLFEMGLPSAFRVDVVFVVVVIVAAGFRRRLARPPRRTRTRCGRSSASVVRRP